MSELTLAVRIDRACNRFEAACKAGPARVEDFVEGFVGDERTALLRELVLLDLEYRSRRGETARPEDYAQRFPELSQLTSVADTPTGGEVASSSDLSVGRVVGNYEILGEIARGGMGVVYRARDVRLNRIVALKMILPGQLVTPEAVQRFRTEAKHVARLEHENVVPIYEVGEYQGQPFFTMKLIEGGSLDGHVERLLVDPRAAAQVLATVARAVHHAHQFGLIHRDLKPSNVLLDAHGQPHFTDFGLAKRLEASIDLTRSNAIVGTPCYMAPEQAGGKQRITVAADVYGLGAVLYEMLTGRPPFKAATPLETLRQVLQDDPVPPSRRRPGVPRDLEVICMKCLAKEPAGRYGSAQELAEDLRRWLAGEAIQARPTTAWERLMRWVRRYPAAAALIVVSFLGSLALVGALVAQSYSARLARLNAQLEEALGEEKNQRDEADRQRALARKSEQNARRFQYVTRMNQAGEADKAGNSGRVLQLLRSVIPESPDQEDLRRWEWHHLWRKHNGEVARLKGHVGPVTGVALSADGKLLASCGADRTVRLWLVATGKEIHTLKGHEGRVNAVAFGPDDARLVTASDDKTVRVWDVVSGKEVQRLQGHEGRVTSVAYCRKTGRIVSGSHDRTVRMWGEDAKAVRVFAGQKVPVYGVAVSPDGKYIASVSQSTAFQAKDKGAVFLWNADTGEVERSTEALEAYCVAFCPRTGVLAHSTGVVTEKKSASTLELLANDPWRSVGAWKGFSAAVVSTQFSHDGRFLVAASHDQTVRLWNVEAGKEVRRFEDEGPVLSVATNADGSALASGGEEGAVRIWFHQPITLRGAQGCVEFSPNGRWLAISSQTYEVGTWEPGPLTHGFTGRGSWCPQSRLLAGGGKISQPGGSSPPPRLTPPGTNNDFGMAFTPDGRLLAAIKSDGGKKAIRLWEIATGKLIRSMPLDTWATDVAISPAGRWLVSAGIQMDSNRRWNSEWLKVWDLETGKLACVLDGFSDCVWRVRFSRDGRFLVAAVGYHWAHKVPGEARVYRADTWELVARLRGHAETVYSADFSPCGRRIVTGGGKKQWEIKVWDLATAQEVWSMPSPPKGMCYEVAFSPCGGWLAACGDKGNAVVLNGKPMGDQPPYQPLPD